ncbi:4-hydroxy-tetrahydrodipicolinate synthase [Cytophagales bacterium LB-30]|uniref:4-hydroxy-tetrahydrodipicolinate synthase n=1 Tax=Shiella aurantiaca TaxID=3058365 RepID=A0ABT8F1L4_9BACT|nr:4-hydroxy-tetrahydrodipicolinate synthase [Shiella aurantiaca]MDN4164347.1 4-hydroxy-tetrahydrodipicolinate synthase [Shiella aurantiaca]
MNLFRGTGVALVTPFHADGSIDWQGLKNLLTHTAQGCDYYVVQGTTGESVTTTAKEKKDLLNFVRINNPKKLPIVYGLGGNNTADCLEKIKKTDWRGVDAILSVSPYYNKPSQEGIYQHYMAIADASPVPVILYNVPGRTGSNISAATTLRLAQHKNIIGIKEASGNMEQCMEIAAHKPADFLLISGDDLLSVPLIALGGVGTISVLANAYPMTFRQMVHKALEGDFAQASQALFQFLAINPLLYAEGNPVGIKEALALQKVCEAHVRLPLVAASSKLKEQIKEAAKQIKE